MSRISDEIVELEEDTQIDKYLTLKVGKEDYGIEIKYVTEIIGMQEITELPQLPEYVKGIINLRGKIIPVLDLRLRFGRELIEYNDRTCIIIIEDSDISAGIIVDTVSDVLHISSDDIVEPPDLHSGYHNKYLKGIGKVGNNVKLIIQCEKLLDIKEM